MHKFSGAYNWIPEEEEELHHFCCVLYVFSM